jgi:N6-adenosine-specific RNA methylase IME4
VPDIIGCLAIKTSFDLLSLRLAAGAQKGFRMPKDLAVANASQALKALAKYETQLESAKTYTEIRRIVDAAQAFKHLLRNVVEVKQRAERVVILGSVRIGAEIDTVKKRGGPGRGKTFTPSGKSLSGRGALDIPGTSRARLLKLKGLGRADALKLAEVLWEAGKDATIKAIIGEAREHSIKAQRADYEARRDRGADVADLVALADAGRRFNVIYADPPWEFKVYSGKGKQRSAERYYDTSSLEAIAALPIKQLAADDCYLFLWGVWPENPGALDIVKAWGFEFKTAGFVWVKTAPSAASVGLDGSGLHWGMGYHTRANTEFCLLATRGSPLRTGKDVHQVVVAPVMEHSEKPEEVRRRIERLTIGPYLELFARHPVPGWTVWGNEIGDELATAAE